MKNPNGIEGHNGPVCAAREIFPNYRVGYAVKEHGRLMLRAYVSGDWFNGSDFLTHDLAAAFKGTKDAATATMNRVATALASDLGALGKPMTGTLVVIPEAKCPQLKAIAFN